MSTQMTERVLCWLASRQPLDPQRLATGHRSRLHHGAQPGDEDRHVQCAMLQSSAQGPAIEVADDPIRDGFGRLVGGAPGGVNQNGNVLPEPLAEGDLLDDISGPPGRTVLYSPLPNVVRAVQYERIDLADPLPSRVLLNALRSQGTQQQGWQSGLGDSVGDSEPRLIESIPWKLADAVGAAQGAGRV